MPASPASPSPLLVLVTGKPGSGKSTLARRLAETDALGLPLLYLSCAKFVTTPEYSPMLRARRVRELELMEDAATRGWEREVERHKCTARHIEQLLMELGESIGEQQGAGHV